MLLCDAQIHNTRKVKMECNTGVVFDLGSLYARFQELHDQRKPRGKRYSLATVLVILCLAKLCGEDRPSGIAEWAKHRGEWIVKVLGLKRSSMPHHNTYRRILAEGVHADELEQLMRAHFQHRGKAGYQVVMAMDGKVLRGTIDTDAQEGLWLLAAYLPEEGVTLAQVALESKQNEISAAPRLLAAVDLRNKVVIGDALHTQRQISIQIGKAGGHFLWTVKGNQPQLAEDLQLWFGPTPPPLSGMAYLPKDFRTAQTVNKGHGRLETRTLTTSSELNDFLDWPFLQQVFKLERDVRLYKSARTRHEIVYGVTSLSAEQAPPEKLLHMLRSYWHIENRLHYRRDVTFQEDRTRFKHHAAAHCMATLNSLLLGILAKPGFQFLPSARRFFAAHPQQALQLLTSL
jgi:predicted transposase YbfD/YdcC